MMEGILINANETIISKAILWADQIYTFQESGLYRKDWYQRNEVPQTTLSYWIRKIQGKATQTKGSSDPVLAKLPSEQKLRCDAVTGNSPVTILLSENIQIKVSTDCPARLMAALMQALKSYA